MVYPEYSASSEEVTQSSVTRTHLTKRLVLKNISFQSTGTSAVTFVATRWFWGTCFLLDIQAETLF